MAGNIVAERTERENPCASRVSMPQELRASRGGIKDTIYNCTGDPYTYNAYPNNESWSPLQTQNRTHHYNVSIIINH